MIVFGKKNCEYLCNAIALPGVGIKTTKFLFLPIYKVEIRYMGKIYR